MLATLQPVALDRTPEWYAARSTGIGASEAAAVCGLSRWDTPLDVWTRKTAQAPPQKAETPAMALGTAMESALWEAFQSQTGIIVDNSGPGMFRHSELSHILASPDALLADGTIGEGKVTTDANEELGDEADSLPFEWICQAFQQMAVMDAPAVRFAVLVVPQQIRQWMLDAAPVSVVAEMLTHAMQRGKADLRTYTVDRHTNGIANLLEKETAFWNEHVLTHTMPPIDWTHSGTVQAVKAACLETVEGEVISLNEEAVLLHQELQKIKSQLKELKSSEDKLSAELLLSVGTAQAGRLPSGDLLKKIVVGEGVVPSYVRKSYCYLRQVKGPKS